MHDIRSVGRFPDDLEVGFRFEQTPQTFPKRRMIIRYYDSDIRGHLSSLLSGSVAAGLRFSLTFEKEANAPWQLVDLPIG
jgi:hypothetical protein